jgi:hypothetical protein
VGLWCALVSDPAIGLAGETGAELFEKRCASCHGAHGEGTPHEYPQALSADRPVAQLARFIARAMPADAPGTCRADEAERLAAYIHEAFSSEATPTRAQTPHLGVTRLTVGQYRNAVADLTASFRTPLPRDDARGLLGDYYTMKPDREHKRVMQRLDPEIRFDFGRSSPDPSTIDLHEFMISWEGSLLAPESGEYEFIVCTEHAARFWLNDLKRPLIDAWIKSGHDTEYCASARLLGGRAYALKLMFSKMSLVPSAVREKTAKDAIPPASIVLKWKRPHHVAEPVPTRYLVPHRAPESLVVRTSFPPDDRSAGFERGASISKAWEQATTEAAIEAAEYVMTHLGDLTGGIGQPTRQHALQLKAFCRQFAERAFRRPLDDEQVRLYIDRSFDSAPDPGAAVQRVVLLTLKSPRFLYHDLAANDAFSVASRLSFALWDSIPDAELLQVAGSGRLIGAEEVAAQARRMAAEPQTASKLREFFLQWLTVDRPPELAKSKARFPAFDAAVASDLRASLELLLDDVLDASTSDFRRLFLTDELYLNGRLARVYGADLPADSPFRRVIIDNGRRAGVLTHPYLMAAFAGPEATSPIHRGVFLTRKVLGRSLRPPPDAFAPLSPSLHPDLTTRQRVELQTSSETCQSCHGMINPLGFALEHFDEIGRYRADEKGHAVDAKGAYSSRTGDSVTFNGARQLAQYLAGSDDVQTAFVKQLFHHTVKQSIRAYGPQMTADLTNEFIKCGFDVRKLLTEIAIQSALRPHGVIAGRN